HERPRHAERNAHMTLDSRTRWLALYVLCLGDLMIVLDTTIVNVALPSIRQDLGFSQTSLAWVVNAYLLTFGGFLLLGGRLGDLFGHRRLFLIGISLFTVASVACGVSTTQGLLVAARAVQGLGGAVVSAVALSLMMNLSTERGETPKAIGIFGSVTAGGGGLGDRPDARAPRGGDRAVGALHRHRSARSLAADAARPLPAAQHRHLECGRDPVGGYDVRMVLRLGALPAVGARLQPPQGRTCFPTGQPDHGRLLDWAVREARHAVRFQGPPGRGPVGGRRRPRAVRPRSSRREFRRRRTPKHDPARSRSGNGVQPGV